MQTFNCPLTSRRLPDIMVNAWSLLYDEMEELMITPADDKDWEDFWSAIENKYEFTLTMNQDPNRWKYSEDEILKELQDYISGTYNAHYSAGDDKIQTLDLIEACGDGESFCRSNILKYASRYDKKGTARRDIMKILHYAVLLMHFNDKNAKRETYPQ
jgi:hypothetical protein